MAQRLPLKLLGGILLFVLYAFLVKTDVSWNDGSRFALLESLVERHTFSIEQSSFFNLTGDKVFVNNHFYSDKAPGLVFLAAPVYALLYQLGFRLTSGLTLAFINLLVAMASVLLVFLFYGVLGYFVKSQKDRLLVTLALAAGTGIIVYAGVFISPNVAALFLVASLYSVLKFVHEGQKPKQAALAGFLGGVAVLVEYPSLILFAGILLYGVLSSSCPRRLLAFSLVFLLPFLVIILVYNAAITGSPFISPYHYLHNWEGSPFSAGENTPDLSRVTGPRLLSMYFMGSVPRAEGIYVRGLFVYSPILLLSLLSLRHFKKKENVFLFAIAAFSLFYLTLTEVTGGCNYVNRYLIPTVPFFLLVIAPLLKQPRIRALFFILLPLSIIANVVGAFQYPFTCAPIPFLQLFTG